jgi:hypothetical protein
MICSLIMHMYNCYILKQNKSSDVSNAVINKKVEIERLEHWVNKMWKRGYINAKLEDKLSFLC